MINKTYLPKISEIKRGWHLIDAKGKPLGRIATQAVYLLRGKNKPFYTPHLDCGDHVVVTNVSQIVLTGKKLEQKIDYHHSGYPGGDKYTVYSKLMAEKPEKGLWLAAKGMLPKNRLAGVQIKRLRIFKGNEHDFADKFAKNKE
ncbi:MAG: 50S ribosomal protein L13 [Elusimicrobia bacterium]|nr:50S ribosomal protein L13 [Candidatus Liberimonas magnetica]